MFCGLNYATQVGGLPETMHLKLIEPLRELFKVGAVRIKGTTGT